MAVPLLMRFGYSAVRGELATRAICRVTGGMYSHCFVIFYPDADNPVYYESIITRNERTGKNGVRGPLPLDKLEAWASADPDRHVYDVQPAVGYLPLTDAEAQAALQVLRWATTAVRYAPLQCLSNWFERRTGILIARHRQKDLAWTCSETDARIMPVRCADLYGWPDSRASEIVPSGDYLPSVWTGTDRLIRRDGVRG